MKRLQIMIDEDLDAELERLSGQTGRSKAALIREFVRTQVKPLPPIEKDPLWEMAGSCEFDPVPPEKLDEVIYGELD